MGLNKNKSSGKFLGITNGKISLRVPEGTEGAVERKITKGKNEGTSVFEVFFDSVDGYIVGGKVERKEVGDAIIESIVVKIKDGLETFNLNIPWNSRIRDSFVKVLPNLDVSKKVEIVVFPDKKDKNPVLLVKQGGERLDWYYTRETPNSLPQPEKKTVKGAVKWDFSSTEDFLWQKTEEFFEQFESDEAPEGQDESVDVEQEEETQSHSGSGDTPF